MSYAFKQYGKDFASDLPILGTGDGFIYSTTPTVTARLIGTISKPYDGTVAASIASGNYLVSGAIDGDTVQLNNPTLGTYTTAGTGSGVEDAGSGKAVGVSGVALSGASDGAATVFGYELDSPAVSGTVGTINPLALTGAAITGSSSIYGSALSPGAVSFSNVLSGDEVSSAAFVNFDGVDLSSSGNLTAGSYSQSASADLAGTDAANYSFSGFTTATPNYSIERLNLTASGVTVANKVYDGTTQATISTAAAALNGLIAGDSVTASGGSGLFSDPNVGLAKSVAVSGLILDGTDAGNYNFASPTTTLSADISIRPLATWQASTAGNWSDATNWDALPSAGNVAAVAIPAGTGAVTYDTAAGSTNLQNLFNDQSLNLTGGSLAVSDTTTVGTGASLSLNGGSFSTTTLVNQGLVNGSGPLVLNGAYSENGGMLGSGFSSVAITQTNGDLILKGVGATGPVSLTSVAGQLNLSGAVSSAGGPIGLTSGGATQLATGSSLASPGALISVRSGGPLSLVGARLEASGGSAGGTVQLDGSEINLANATLNTSGASDGGAIQIGLRALPSSVTISNSSLAAEAPDLGGSISIDGASIPVNGSTLNVTGLNGGSIVLGSATNTANLSLDALTSLVGGSGATFNLFGSSILNNASIVGGKLFVNGVAANGVVPPVVDGPPAIGVPPVIDAPPIIGVPPVTDGPPVIGVPPVTDGPPVIEVASGHWGPSGH